MHRAGEEVGQVIYEAWDDPSQGLTPADFARWPDLGGGLSRVDRNKTAALLQGAADNGDLGLPVYIVGKCATYPTPNGHPAFAGAIDGWNTFALWGQPGTAWPNITTIKTKGLLSKRVISTRLPAFNHVEVEEFRQSNGGYLDLQMSRDGMPTARIGFYYSPGLNGRAHDQVQALFRAVETCRNGLLPNGQPASPTTPTAPATELATAGSAGQPLPEVDWRDPQVIRAEWGNDSMADDWGNAMSMFDEGPVVGQRLNVAEYMTRRLKFVLLGRSDLPEELVAEACRRILVLLSEPVLGWQEGYVPRLVRLPLAIMRERGWQPPKYGGDGTVAVDLDVRPITDSVATSLAPGGDHLGYFFGTIET